MRAENRFTLFLIPLGAWHASSSSWTGSASHGNVEPVHLIAFPRLRGRRAMPPGCKMLQLRCHGFHLLGDLAPALVKAHLFVRFQVFLRPVQCTRDVACLAVAGVLQGNDGGEEGFFRWLPGAGISVRDDDLLVLD